jgi:hypothetical protein
MMESGTHENWKVRNRMGKFTLTDTFYSAGTPFNVALKGEERSWLLRRRAASSPPAHGDPGADADGPAPLGLDSVAVRRPHRRLQGLKMSVGIGRVMTPGGMLDGIAKTEGTATWTVFVPEPGFRLLQRQRLSAGADAGGG